MAAENKIDLKKYTTNNLLDYKIEYLKKENTNNMSFYYDVFINNILMGKIVYKAKTYNDKNFSFESKYIDFNSSGGKTLDECKITIENTLLSLIKIIQLLYN